MKIPLRLLLSSLILPLLFLAGPLSARQDKFDPRNLELSDYSLVDHKQTFSDKEGNLYKVKKTKSFRGIYVQIQDGESTKWVRHGRCYSIHSDGTLESFIDFVAGVRHGERRSFNRKGMLKFLDFYAKGLKHGLSTQYRDDGSVAQETPFVKGKLHGKRISYRHKKGVKRGAIDFTTEWVNGLRHGEKLHFNSKGKLIERSTFREGKIVGKTQHFN